MKKLPKEAKLTPQVGNKTRHTDDYENEIEAGKHNVKSPYPLVYDHEDNDSKELEQYEFDHWDYRNKDGKWQECGAGDSISDLINNSARQPITSMQRGVRLVTKIENRYSFISVSQRCRKMVR